jgi:hypothetical protein
MTLQYTPVSLPLLLSATLSGGLGVYAWRHRHGREGVLAFALLNFACGLWALAEVLELASADFAWQYFWGALLRLPLSTALFFWVAFAAQYTGWGSLLNRRALAFLSAPLVGGVLLAWTNEWHHLMWTDWRQTDWHG